MNFPIPSPVPELNSITCLEQLLISSVLPMICDWRNRGFGQCQSKKQCVAFYNKAHNIASVLPGTLKDVVMNIKESYGSQKCSINVNRVRIALAFIKANHQAFENLQICESTLCSLEESAPMLETLIYEGNKVQNSHKASAANVYVPANTSALEITNNSTRTNFCTSTAPFR